MALISKVDRVSRVFQQEWKTWCCDKIEEVKVSQLSQEDQDNFWRRDAELHPSSFPFCGLRDAYERLTRSEDPVVQQNFSSDFYLNCGTVTHTASQNWLGKSKRLIGTWVCEACGNTRAFGPRPKVCRCGSVRIKYEELGGVDGEISWHTDGLFFYNGEYWLIDFKTSSTYAIEKANEARKQGKKADLPYAKNVFQIESYTVLVERKYNIKITGWLLIYMARDKPNSVWSYHQYVVGKQLTDARREQLWERINKFESSFKISKRAREYPVQVFKKMIPAKLCGDKEFYETYVKSPFEECPLGDCCFKPRQLMAKLKEAAANGPQP